METTAPDARSTAATMAVRRELIAEASAVRAAATCAPALDTGIE